ncbi:hypothetical protein GE118_01235 [Mycoplasma sp. NEAQ87857]|nr:hypothetical protein GE118_01235 [Mycoplasma sp. NEAQ87857]
MCIASGSKEHIGKVAFISNNIENYSFGAFMAKIKTLKSANPRFIYHFLTSDKLNDQLHKLIDSSTINNINNDIYSNINITIPSLSVQNKIVNVLDNFKKVCSSLNIGLPKEIELRNKQYQYYRDQIFNYLNTGKFDRAERERERLDLVKLLLFIFDQVEVSLEDIGYFYNGLTGKTQVDFTHSSNSYFVSFIDVFNNIEINNDLKLNNKVQIKENEKQNKVLVNDLLFTGSSENQNECAMCCLYNKQSDERVYLNSFSFGLRLYDYNFINPHYLKFLFHTNNLRSNINRCVNGVTRFNLSKDKFKKIKIVIPSLSIQNKIVNILDNLHQISNDFSQGIPLEIALRQKQYNYYRNYVFSLLNQKYKK